MIDEPLSVAVRGVIAMSDELQIMLFSTVQDLWSRPTSVRRTLACEIPTSTPGLRSIASRMRSAYETHVLRIDDQHGDGSTPARKVRVLTKPLRADLASGGGWHRQPPGGR